jgi:hypothetical protein
MAKDGFGEHAPSKNLPFPKGSANLTAVELLTFLPNSLKSTDVVYRLVSNDGTRNHFWAIVNTNRHFERAWHPNTCGSTVYKAMRDAGFKDWTINTHSKWHQNRANWSQWNLDVKGFRVPCDIVDKGSLAPSVPFADMAIGVRSFPKGNDALDLTRMVQYAVEHPQDDWLYPLHYEKLLSLLGGPRKVEVEHLDKMAFLRWKDHLSPPTPSGKITIPGRNDGGGHAKNNRNAGDVEMEHVEAEENGEPGEYFQGRMVWVPPPTPSARPPTDDEVTKSFHSQGDKRFCNPFNPYAFDGPRGKPPFRPLHQIGDPRMNDVSGWAENLRWAKEHQAMCTHPRNEGWNESPQHMKLIYKARVAQKWVSVEWMEWVQEEDQKLIEVQEALRLHEKADLGENNDPFAETELYKEYLRGHQEEEISAYDETGVENEEEPVRKWGYVSPDPLGKEVEFRVYGM